MDKLKIISINVRGLRNKKKRFAIMNWLKTKNFDIAYFQETFITQNICKEIEKDFSLVGKIFSCFSDSSHSRGVSVLLSHNLSNLEVIDIHKGTDGRKIMINATLLPSNRVFSLVSVYAPNNDKDKIKFIQECYVWVDTLRASNSQILMGGDFNTTYRRKDRASGNIDKAGVAFKDMMSSLQLQDTFAHLNPKQTKYTYIHSSNHSRNSRIDYLLVSTDLKNSIQVASTLCCPAPDHKAVITEICLAKKTRGKGYWKLNNSLLKDDTYIKKVEQEIRLTLEEYGHA